MPVALGDSSASASPDPSGCGSVRRCFRSGLLCRRLRAGSSAGSAASGPPRERSSSATALRRPSAPSGGFVDALGDRRGGVLLRRGEHADVLGAEVAHLAHAGGTADAPAQVVELGPADLTAAMTSIRSILGECTGNVRSTPTPNDSLRTVKVRRRAPLLLEDDALEDLGAAAGALHDLEMDAYAIAHTEVRNCAHLTALDAVDQLVHGDERAASVRRLQGINAGG